MIPFDEALEQCIEAVHAGTSVADCLARYPDYAERLSPLLAVAAELYAAPLEVMSNTGFERQRLRVREQMLAARKGQAVSNGVVGNGVVKNGVVKNGVVGNGAVNGKPTIHHPPSPPHHPSSTTHRPPSTLRRPWWSNWPVWATSATQRAGLLTAVILIALVTALGGVTLASAKAAPSAPLYSVRLIVENVVDALPAPPEVQVNRALERAEERLADGLTVCATDPSQADSLLQQITQQRDRALSLLGRVSGPSAEALRTRAENLRQRAERFERDCAQTQSAAPAATDAPQPAALPLATDTVTPEPTAVPATATARPTASPTATATATTVPTSTVVTGGASGSTQATVSGAASTVTVTQAATRASLSGPANTAVPPTQPLPTQPPATATSEPPTAEPATATPRPNPTAAPPPEPTAPPTAAPPPTAIPLPTAIVEPPKTPIPTDEPRPTQPPATQPPTLAPPPTPTIRLLENPTKQPTQPSTQPTSRPVEVTPNIPPGRPTPRR